MQLSNSNGRFGSSDTNVWSVMGVPEKSPTQNFLFSKANRGVGNQPVGTTRTTPNVGAFVLARCPEKLKTTSTTKIEPSTFHPLRHVKIPLPQEVFPPNPRPRPRPMLFFASTAALASRSRCTICSAPFHAAKCSGVSPREPQPRGPSPQAEPIETKGKQTLRKFWHLKSGSFGKCGHTNSSLADSVSFWDVLRPSSWLKKPCQQHVGSQHDLDQ